jgi:CheY-like chemotaxis protein
MASAAKVLLVDDDPDGLDVVRQALDAGGYRVVTASDTASALEAAVRERPDLVITDLMMESMDAGFEFARRVRENADLRSVPLIILTAIGARTGFDFRPSADDDLRAMCADAFLEKPCRPAALLAKVRELLDRRRPETKP